MLCNYLITVIVESSISIFFSILEAWACSNLIQAKYNASKRKRLLPCQMSVGTFQYSIVFDPQPRFIQLPFLLVIYQNLARPPEHPQSLLWTFSTITMSKIRNNNIKKFLSINVL